MKDELILILYVTFHIGLGALWAIAYKQYNEYGKQLSACGPWLTVLAPITALCIFIDIRLFV